MKALRTSVLVAISAVIAVGISIFSGCRPEGDTSGPAAVGSQEVKDKIDTARLEIHLKLNPDAWEWSDYGEPPQIAIWLESPDGKQVKTAFVTHRTAKGDWKGKLECPVSLPYWVGRWNDSTGTLGDPTAKNPLPDAITAATPKDELAVRVDVPRQSEWKVFIEVNVASDFNQEYPTYVDGMPDPQMNGQPSIVYQGLVKAQKGQIVVPAILGRTDQIYPSYEIIKEVESLTTIKDIFKTIEIRCID